MTFPSISYLWPKGIKKVFTLGLYYKKIFFNDNKKNHKGSKHITEANNEIREKTDRDHIIRYH